MNREERLRADGITEDVEPFLFYGGWPSNFSRHDLWLPHPFIGLPVRYRTGEHRFQAMKATTAEDHDYVNAASGANGAKARGREITLRADWGDDVNTICWFVMLEVTTTKAVAHADVRAALMATTGRHIYEDSPYDDLWGWRRGDDHSGKNLLGRSWMRTRWWLQRLHG